MRRSSFFLPIIALLIVGAGCALSSADTKRQVTELPNTAPADSVAQTSEESAKKLVVADVQVESTGDVTVEPVVPPVIRNINLKDGEFFFDPKSISVKKNETFTITFADVSGHHTFNIDELNLHADISAGKVITVTAPANPGRYSYYCNIGPHRTLGMEGVLVVE